MNENMIPADANPADFINEDEFRCGAAHTAENGKRYVELTAGIAQVGMTAVRIVKVCEEGRRGPGKLLGYHKEVVGIVTGLGKAFFYAGSDIETQRAYIEG